MNGFFIDTATKVPLKVQQWIASILYLRSFTLCLQENWVFYEHRASVNPSVCAIHQCRLPTNKHTVRLYTSVQSFREVLFCITSFHERLFSEAISMPLMRIGEPEKNRCTHMFITTEISLGKIVLNRFCYALFKIQIYQHTRAYTY